MAELVSLKTSKNAISETEDLLNDLLLVWGYIMNIKDVAKLMNTFAEVYPDCDIELQMGGQPIYYYVISVE